MIPHFKYFWLQKCIIFLKFNAVHHNFKKERVRYDIVVTVLCSLHRITSSWIWRINESKLLEKLNKTLWFDLTAFDKKLGIIFINRHLIFSCRIMELLQKAYTWVMFLYFKTFISLANNKNHHKLMKKRVMGSICVIMTLHLTKQNVLSRFQ